MKRVILSGFLVATIVGLSTLSIHSNCEVSKLSEKTLIDLVGDRHALGDKKLWLKTQMVNEHQYIETIFSEKGLEATTNVEGNLDILADNRNFRDVDRKLVRGFTIRNTNENEKFAVALNHEAEKGITVKYKNKETNKYREFVIQDKGIMTWLDLSNIYVKDNFAYGVLSSYEGSKVIKINLSSEKIVKIIDFPVVAKINENYQGDNRALVKDNKMYIAGYDSAPNYGFISFTFDLDKETITYKKVEGERKNLDDKTSYVTSVERDENFAYYSILYQDKKSMDIIVYDMLQDNLREFSITNVDFKNLENLNIQNCKVMDNKLYISGRMSYSSEKTKIFTSVFNWNKKSLEYFGCVNDNLLQQNTITEIR